MHTINSMQISWNIYPIVGVPVISGDEYIMLYNNLTLVHTKYINRKICILPCNSPCYILNNLQESTSEDCMPSQNLRQNLSRISNSLKNTHKPLKKTYGSTSNTIQSVQFQKNQKTMTSVTNTMRQWWSHNHSLW